MPFILSLLVPSIIPLLLLLFRIWWTGSFQYGFLAWNLVLSGVAVALYHLVRKYDRWYWHLCWILVLPNTFYLLTDFVHLKDTSSINYFFEIGMFGSAAAIGFWHGSVMLADWYKKLHNRFTPGGSRLMLGLAIIACSSAITLGRFSRWNSWDVVTKPIGILADVGIRLAHPLHFSGELTVFAVFIILITASFLAINMLSYIDDNR
jgi:uncharacterized membrane protein